ncbi:hypothetical protein ACFOUV_11230 [Oceanobacillus longus]|uniref:Uncharacterized protein n=1 Tax=Oceanobacillus longus TaxID=930120 RepID=A0ABV8GX09_9BACI
MSNEETNQKPSEMNPEDLPDVRAFQDEFTRGFLQSSVETEPGYYPFLSGTGAYQMGFPAGGIIGEQGYARENKNFESFLIGDLNSNGLETSIDIKYFLNNKEGDEIYNLEILNSQFNDELAFEEINLENRKLFIAPFEGNYENYGYASYLQNTESSGGVQIIYDTLCTLETDKCMELKDIQQDEIVNWMKSVEFVNEKNEREN